LLIPSSGSYVSLIKRAKATGYTVTLLYFWLYSSEEAIMRVAERVNNGGHHIPDEVAIRRYERGIYNFHNLYKNTVDARLFFDNSDDTPNLIAKGDAGFGDIVVNMELWSSIYY
jgi:predicted ABC-type ATPase